LGSSLTARAVDVQGNEVGSKAPRIRLWDRKTALSLRARMMMACKVSAAMTGVMVSLDREERAVKTSSEASEFSAAVGIQRAWDLAPFSPASSRIAVSAARWYGHSLHLCTIMSGSNFGSVVFSKCRCHTPMLKQ
jgi:hypothetical protein